MIVSLVACAYGSFVPSSGYAHNAQKKINAIHIIQSMKNALLIPVYR